MSVPYAQSTSGMRAREEIRKLLQEFGCESVGFMDCFADSSLVLCFTWHGRQIQLKASAQGWANYYLQAKPWNPHRSRSSEEDFKRRAYKQGNIAINSILRDWVKGQLTAVETGVLTFQDVFLPYMLTASGRTVGELAADPQNERFQKLLTP